MSGHGIRFAENLKVLPVLGAVDLAGTAAWTKWVDVDLAHWVTFIVNFGSCSSAGATCDDCCITVECSSVASTAGHEEVNFTYRLSSAVDTDNMGAITTGTSAGVTFGPLLDNKTIVIDVDPAEIEARTVALGVKQRWCAVHMVPASTSNIVSVTAVIEPRSPGYSIPSST